MRSVQKKAGTASLSDINIHLSDVEISTFTISSKSKITGKSLIELDLRKNYGVTVLAIRRGDEMISSPDSSLTLQARDFVILVGEIEKINQVESLF
jgi:K+/H+ antiporter YhaU regulatory subunit KhtT